MFKLIVVVMGFAAPGQAEPTPIFSIGSVDSYATMELCAQAAKNFDVESFKAQVGPMLAAAGKKPVGFVGSCVQPDGEETPKKEKI